MKRTALILLGLAAITALLLAQTPKAGPQAPDASPRITEGQLRILGEDGKPHGLCPLKHTDVKAEISGFVARVTVTQQFHNPSDEKIEAVYVFPLPQHAAVDDMTLKVAERTVRGVIKRREEAQKIYDAARSAGHVAALLDQERPNIFTQSVANIMPGEEVEVTISYVETLKYEDGAYEFAFPMVVGPRYIPGNAVGRQGGGWAPDTDQVQDASRITPPVAKKGTRAGHDIALEVTLDAGVAIQEMRSVNHEVATERRGASAAVVRLRNEREIPNRDFVLKYDVAGGTIDDALLTHRARGSKSGYFAFILQPPERVTAAEVVPKELVFVLDTSGSMSGFPIEKAKEAMKHALDGLYPQDTFNLITFAGDTHVLFPQPVPATKENLVKAQEFLAGRRGSGGTEMMKAIRAALTPSRDALSAEARGDMGGEALAPVRIVCFMTDGYVGNDMEIIAEVKKNPHARVFSFGIGSSVNRFLLDGMAAAGRGEVEYVALNDDGSTAARRFHERVRSPLLTDIELDWGSLPVADVQPARIPDLFAAKPLVITGRFTGAANGTIRLKGNRAGEAFTRSIQVSLPEAQTEHDALSKLWARARIDELMAEDWSGLQSGNMQPKLKETITQLGLEHRLMTQFTSFVAVEERIVTENGEPRRVEVPVEMPQGVSHEGVFGNRDHITFLTKRGSLGAVALSPGIAMSESAVVVSADSSTVQTTDASVRSNVSVREDEQAHDEVMAARRAQDARARQQLESKLHPALLALWDCARDKKMLNSDPACAPAKQEKVEVQVWLVQKTEKAMARLKALGFEVLTDPQGSNLVTGRIAVKKLAALAKLDAVRHVAADPSVFPARR
jgi:Ca-activated chloride channel family protein